jgi:UDP-N-acetylmuramoyl-tripeptide--D-alanyl-D-alanine ligase
MMRRTLEEVAALAGGVLPAGTDPAVLVTAPVVADSQRVVAGGLFVAVAGERVDGHDFAAAALAGGAVAVLASRALTGPAIIVDDTVLGLGRLAQGYLSELRATGSPLVVSITGSSGKTSTKDLLAQVLRSRGETVAPEGSFNTEVGLPLTVLRADAATRYLVLEASSRGIGHIAYLCGIARPDIAVVLNVGAAHLGEFGSREAVAQAKGELVESLGAGGVAVLSADDAAVAAMASRTVARVVTFGRSSGADVRAVDVVLDDQARAAFTLSAAGGSVGVRLALHGAHHVSNALAVAAVALETGMALADVAAALGEARPVSHWRMEVTTRADGVTVINDAYNANPDSMRAALDALAAMTVDRAGSPGRRWAVLGRMAELGVASVDEHEQLGAAVAAAGVDRLVVVGAGSSGPGEDVAAIADGARRAGLPAASVSDAADAGEAAALLGAELGAGDVVLIKASRSADLQRVAQALLAPTPAEVRA